MTDEIKYIDLAEFRSEGYLQEINRCFLHPLGLALQLNIPEPDAANKTTITGLEDSWRVETIGREGQVFVSIFAGPDAEERAKGYFDVCTKPTIYGIIDHRDDPEGMYFDFKSDSGNPMYLEEATRMYLNVSAKGYDKIVPRVKFFNKDGIPFTRYSVEVVQDLKYNIND